MKTNFDKLTSFEAASVFVAVIGVSLIGFEIFYSLPTQNQADVKDAFSILDIHDQVATLSDSITGNVGFVYDTTQSFYDQFALAFQQEFSLPDQVGAPLLSFAQNFSEYSAAVAANYQANVAVGQSQYTLFLTSALTNSNQVQSIAASKATPTVSGANTTSSDSIEQQPAFSLPYHYEMLGVVKKYFQ